MTLRKRLTAIERALNPTPPEVSVIRVYGGMSDGDSPLRASAGSQVFTLAEGETEDAFTDRVVRAAREAQESFVVIGGLPDQA
jgi:hypothetical protein